MAASCATPPSSARYSATTSTFHLLYPRVLVDIGQRPIHAGAMSSRLKSALSPRIARLVVVVAICLSLGLQWALLQGVAWAGMLVSFASEGTVIEAVQKTFDGQHGCPLCKKVKEGSHSNRKQPHQAGHSMQKINAVLVEVTALVAPVARTISFAPLHERLVQRTELPETPPPRRGLV